MNKLLTSLIFLLSKVLLFLTLVHFVWTFSEIHAIILVLALTIEKYSTYQINSFIERKKDGSEKTDVT